MKKYFGIAKYTARAERQWFDRRALSALVAPRSRVFVTSSGLPAGIVVPSEVAFERGKGFTSTE